MKKSELFFAVLLLPIDLFFIVLAFVLAYWLRGTIEIPEVIYMWPFSQYLKFVLIFLPFWVLIFALEGLYNIQKPKKGLEELSSIFLGVSAGITIMLVWIFLGRFLFFSRLIIIYAWVLAIILVALGRFLLRLLQRFLYTKGIGLQKVIVIGQREQARHIAQEIKKNPGLGFKLVKMVDKNGLDKLKKIIEKYQTDQVILADPSLSETQAEKVLKFCEDKKLSFKMVPNLFRVKTTNVGIGALSSYPLLEFRRTPLEGWGKIIKRAFDLLGSVLGLIILSPLFLILALLIKLDSKGSIFFRHKRVGNEGREFDFLKFRSMIEKAPLLYKKLAKKKKKVLFFTKIQKDPRITRMGRFLRATCLDELPQLFNVLKGEMSLVGPRPLTPEEFKQVKNYEKRYHWVSFIKPGMTGLWQVSGRSALSDQERLSLDLYYLENWSLLLDLWLLFKTPLAILTSKGEE